MVKFEPYFVRNGNTITVYLEDTSSYHRYLNEKVSVILASISNRIVGVEITLGREDKADLFISEEEIKFIEEMIGKLPNAN